MPANDPRVDAYIKKAAPFAQPILKHIRTVVYNLDQRRASREFLEQAVNTEYYDIVAQVQNDEDFWACLSSGRARVGIQFPPDYSARVQTVSKHVAPRYHALLTAFGEKTGCGMLVNTSFNVRGEPIVCTPQDAYLTVGRSGIDMLAIGNLIVEKNKHH